MSYPISRALQIAQVVYEAKRAWATANGHGPIPSWDKAPESQRKDTFEAVMFYLDNPLVGDAGLHNRWMQAREKYGWKWGKVRNDKEKEDPEMVLFHLRSPEYQAKHRLVTAIIRALARV